MRWLIATGATAAALVAPVAAQASPATHWYWTPALCKSKAINSGLNINGSILKVYAIRCFGLQDCWVSDGIIRYDHFLTFALDGNGVVRSFKVNVTGKTSGNFSDMRVWKGTSWDNLEYALGQAGVRPVDSSTCARGNGQNF